MAEYNGYILPDIPARDEAKYPIVFISVYPQGFACLSFADKLGFVTDLDGDGNRTYSLLQTSQDPYEETKLIFGKEFVAALSDPVSNVLNTVYPGISTGAWMELPWELGNFDIPEGSYYAMSCGTGPHWTNTTLYDVSGNVVIQGAGAEQAGFPLESWLTGFALGLAGKPLPMGTVEREPVAYLYNGVRLPKLPEWDKKKYPYVMMWDRHGGTYGTVYAFSVAHHKIMLVEGATETAIGVGAGETYLEISYGMGDYSQFQSFTEKTPDSPALLSREVHWSNYDIVDENGTLFLAASDPVPIYE